MISLAVDDFVLIAYNRFYVLCCGPIMHMAEEEKSKEITVVVSGEQSAVEQGILEEMAKAGVLYGRRKSKTNPRMLRYIFTTRNGMEILDIVQTIPLLERAEQFLSELVRTKKSILFVGTTPAAKDVVKVLAEKSGFPSVTERWLGGTLTNWKTIHERLQYYLKLKADRETGKLEKYTKKERVAFDKEIARLTHLFQGLEIMTKLPDAIVVVGVTSHETAIREARRLKIPIVGILSSDADPEVVDFVVPANDLSKSSVRWILDRFEKVMEAAKREIPAVASTPTATPGAKP